MDHPILFLDMDGVANDHSGHPRTRYCRTDPSCVEQIDRILVATGARIVLTSSWRYLVHSGSMTLNGLRNLLHTHWIDGDRLLGITRRDIKDSMGGFPASECLTDRGRQVSDWLASWFIGMPYLRSMPYVAIDDMDLGYTEEGHPFVDTDGRRGLTESEADAAIRILMG